jgi:hypothetical protein
MKPAHAANDNLIGRTRQFWRARTRRDLTDEDAWQIADNATGLCLYPRRVVSGGNSHASERRRQARRLR